MEDRNDRKDHLKWRKSLVRILEELLYEAENKRRNHTFVYEHFGQYLTSVRFPTFLKYKDDTRSLDDSEVPDHVLTGMLAMRYYFRKGSVEGFEREHARELGRLRRALKRRVPEKEA